MGRVAWGGDGRRTWAVRVLYVGGDVFDMRVEF